MPLAHRGAIAGNPILASSAFQSLRRVGLALELLQGFKRLLVMVDGVDLSRACPERYASDHRSDDCNNDDHQYNCHCACTTACH